MNKKVIVIVVALMAVAMLATPLVAMVTAAPSQGQKVPVTLKWKPIPPSTVLERRDVDGGISHRIILQNWAVQLFIDDAVTPLEGTAVVMRETLYRYAKPDNGVDQVVNDNYVISFPTAGGGFEGNAHILLTDYVSSTSYTARVHGLFHGTGAFEGQTLNVGVDKGPGANMVWEGYLLKS